jgi:hypothetical protein
VSVFYLGIEYSDECVKHGIEPSCSIQDVECLRS